MEKLMKEHPEIDAVLSANDSPVLIVANLGTQHLDAGKFAKGAFVAAYAIGRRFWCAFDHHAFSFATHSFKEVARRSGFYGAFCPNAADNRAPAAWTAFVFVWSA
jgi:hypothetical protein